MAERQRSEPHPVVQLGSLRLLWRRRRLLAIPWIVITALGIVAAIVSPSVYESSVVLALRRLPAPAGGASGADGASPAIEASLMSEQARTIPFLSGVIAATGIDRDSATRVWALRSANRYPGSSRDEAVKAFLIDHLREAIAVTSGRHNEFTITVVDPDRARARTLAQGAADQLVRVSQARQIQEVGRIQESNVEQLQNYSRQVEESEGRLATFRRNSPGMDEGDSARVDAARAAQEKTRIEAEDLTKRADALHAQLAGRVRDEDLRALSSRKTSALVADRAALERRLADAMLTDSTTTDPGGIRLSIVHKHAELATELSRAAASALPKLPAAVRELAVYCRLAQADLAGVTVRRDLLARRVAALEQRTATTTDQEAELKRLTADVERAHALRDSLVKQSAAAQLAEAFAGARLSGQFEILQPARWPAAPARPNRLAVVLLAFLVGGVIGIGTVMIVERFDTSMKDAKEIGRLLELPLLGALPRVAELEAPRRGPFPSRPPIPFVHGLLHGLKVETPLGLQFRRVYLELTRARGRQVPRTLVVTSATRGEGKSTTAACLGITLARELRQRVLMVDFDLRHPGLHRPLALPSSSWGLAQMLGERRFDMRFVRATVLPNLDFLPAGKSERPADELIDAGLVEWFVQEAANRYAFVVMDCASNLTVPDALIVGRAAEGVVFVVKAGATTRRAAENGVRTQREWRDNLVGVLINDADGILPPYHDLPSREYDYGSEMVGGQS